MTERDPLSTPAVPGGLPFDASQIQFTQATVYPAGTLGAHDQSIISVKDAPYNAKGDGVTDDTAAIQAAINSVTAGSTVFFPPGTYLLSGSGLSITTNLILRGSGHASVLTYNGSGVGITVNSGIGANGKTKLVDFAITTTAGTPTTGILVTGSTFVTIENVYCSVFPIGFDLLSSFVVRLSHVQFDAKAIGDNSAASANTKIGIRMTLCNSCVMDGESLVLRTQFGVQLIACSLCIVRDSDIEYGTTPVAGGIGLKITAQSATNSYGNRIDSVWFEDNDSAIVLDGSAASSGSGVIGTLIIGNEFETLSGGWQAINIIKASKTTIIGGNTSVAAIANITVTASTMAPCRYARW